MKLFIIWANSNPEMAEELLALKARGHEIVYWVGYVGSDLTEFSGTIFHEHYAAWAGNPPESMRDMIVPPSADLIREFSPVENIILHMMAKRFDVRSVDERRHLYFRMLGYWHAIIEKYRPDAILFPTVPHTVYNYIIYEIARRRDIKTVMFEDTWVSDRLLKYKDFREGSRELHEAIAGNRGKDFRLEDLSEDLRSYYQTQVRPESEVPPVYLVHWKKTYSGIHGFMRKLEFVPGSLKDWSIFRKTFRYLTKRIRPNLRREYMRLEKAPDFSMPFVYFPLNYQPERTTSPHGDIFVDQILVAEMLAASLPNGWQLYVKEHPYQWWARTGITYSSVRYPKYYESIAALPNVRLVPIRTNSFHLTNKSKAVAVVTGTAGWEGLMRSKPALVFGYPWFRDCPGVFRVNSAETCREALGKIVAGFGPKPQEIINYLKSFDEATIHGYIERFVDRQSKLSHRESLANVFASMGEEIEKIS